MLVDRERVFGLPNSEDCDDSGPRREILIYARISG